MHKINDELDGIEVLVGTETNILPDGSPDYDDELLAQLDWVVGSVHTGFGIGSAEMTRRVIAALEHPYIDCIGHLTGRKLERRNPYEIDVDAVFAAAARTGTMLEINSAPDRRDLNDVHARQPRAAGVTIVINTDAHGVATQGISRWGMATARRAGLTAADVANTRPWPAFAKLRKRARWRLAGSRRGQQLLGHDAVDRRPPERRDRGQGPRGVAGVGVVQGAAQRAAGEASPHPPRPPPSSSGSAA